MIQTAILFEEPKRRRGGPGRPARRNGSWVVHRARPWHDANHPVHVTLKVRRHLPNLRSYRLVKAIHTGLRLASTSTAPKKAARRATFRVVHFSVQPNHLHLIVEATSKTALARGMQGLASGLARRVNRKLRRRGAVFIDRYHAHAMASPREVRNAIVYVLKNYEKHPDPVPDLGTAPRRGIDPCSSARWFEDWAESTAPPRDLAPPVATPRTWLLRVGWKRTGLVRPEEGPAMRPRGTGSALTVHAAPPRRA
jgi:REP element-mobilizing transposase RayT